MILPLTWVITLVLRLHKQWCLSLLEIFASKERRGNMNSCKYFVKAYHSHYCTQKTSAQRTQPWFVPDYVNVSVCVRPHVTSHAWLTADTAPESATGHCNSWARLAWIGYTGDTDSSLSDIRWSVLQWCWSLIVKPARQQWPIVLSFSPQIICQISRHVASADMMFLNFETGHYLSY